MEELNFDEMRDQITLLKQKLDQQEIVNDRLLRETMRSRMGAINWTKYRNINLISVLLFVLCSILYCRGRVFLAMPLCLQPVL